MASGARVNTKSDRVLASFSVRGVVELYPLSRAAEALTGLLQQ
jgi:hypothetical protein